MPQRAQRLTLALAVVAALAALPAFAQDLATVDVGPTGIGFAALDHDGGFALTVSAPDGTVHRFTFPAGTPPRFDLVGGDFGDGAYNWELRPIAAPVSRIGGNGAAVTPKVLQSGSFAVAGGSIVTGGVEAKGASGDSGGPLAKDQVIPDDLIVNGGSLCVGLDCVNGESFGFDTIRLKENNLRIKFQDTSASASFPTNDWQITANDSSNGGQNKFAIDDIDGGRTPFTIEASAPSHSLYVDDGGRIGLGTSTPVVELHVVDGDTPTLRLEQDGSSGFTPQTWDVAGNEAGFFVRDATNGSNLAFRIRPGAAASSIDIAANENVGFNTSAPTAAVHVRRTSTSTAEGNTADLFVEGNNGETKVVVQENSTTNGDRELFKLSNNGTTRFSLDATPSTSGTGNNWRVTSANNGDFTINASGLGLTQLRINPAGDVTTSGTVNGVSDRDAKENFAEVDAKDVLAKVLDMPIASWNYKHQQDAVRHLGPVAQDFHAAFGLGNNDVTIALSDASGVALAAIQGLGQTLEEKDATIGELKAENAELAARLAKLEALVEALAAAD